MTFTPRRAIRLAVLALAGTACSNLSATPISAVLTGTVTEATGSLAGDVGTTVDASLGFDLDPLLAYEIVPDFTPGSTRWTFFDGGLTYGATFSSGGSAFLEDDGVDLETLDGFVADSGNNPFGLVGTVDALLLNANSTIVDCPPGVPIDPVTGCADPNAAFDTGMELTMAFIRGDDWFSGDVLPTTFSLGDFSHIFADVQVFDAGVLVGTAVIDFGASIPATGGGTSGPGASVPEPAAIALLGAGLAVGGLGGLGRRRAG